MKRASLAAAAALLSAAPASAHVLEITPEGEAVVISAEARTTAPVTERYTVTATAAQRRAMLQPELERAGAHVALSPLLLEAVAWAESRFNTQARSSAGAIGAMQLMPGTAADLGVNPHHPSENVRGGARYLRAMLIEFDGDLELALAAYNAGPGAVRRHNGVPPYPETRAYVAAVLGYMAERATEETAQ